MLLRKCRLPVYISCTRNTAPRIYCCAAAHPSDFPVLLSSCAAVSACCRGLFTPGTPSSPSSEACTGRLANAQQAWAELASEQQREVNARAVGLAAAGIHVHDMVPAKAGISGPDADEAAVSGAASASSRGSQSAAAWMAVAQTRTSFQLLPSFAASHPGSAPVVRVAGETIDCFWNKRRLHVAWGPFGSSGWLVCDSQASCALRHRRSASYSAEVLASASSPVLASCDVEFHFHVDRENQLTKTDLHHLLYRAIQELPRSSSSSSAASSARTTTGAAAGSGSGSGSGSAAAAAAASRAAAAATATRRSVANVLATVLALAEFRDEVFLDEPELSARLLQLARAVAFPKLDKLVALVRRVCRLCSASLLLISLVSRVFSCPPRRSPQLPRWRCLCAFSSGACLPAVILPASRRMTATLTA